MFCHSNGTTCETAAAVVTDTTDIKPRPPRNGERYRDGSISNMDLKLCLV